ncbi:MarR family transcriptional regulator [Clostridium sp. D2Q-14]|uniref:MarR family winged helix-turn-helix transcriptional regulator n=1 Tax=Anaeromonas gelatinilytica TaxID=2683194 RepID=UPI00193BD14E|nr:MarR family transcriptional regulator [Anaeromonas gelatinilytica]MBS4535205.1 MarR family transcriptional regulator [Anaeromonas gelatinilytica]
MELVVDIEKNLREIDYIIRKKGREILKDFSITTPQFVALQFLASSEGLTIGELSNKMALACSTITDLVDRMEKNDLVSRFKDDKDRRVVRVKAEEKGHQLVEDVLVRRQAYLLEKLIDFSDKEKESLAESLFKLYKVMK